MYYQNDEQHVQQRRSEVLKAFKHSQQTGFTIPRFLSQPQLLAILLLKLHLSRQSQSFRSSSTRYTFALSEKLNKQSLHGTAHAESSEEQSHVCG
jgi:hypothetical protein